MDPKKRPNHRQYIEVLRRLPPERRLLKSFELSEYSRALFRTGLRRRYPGISEEEFQGVFLERLAQCHNRNY